MLMAMVVLVPGGGWETQRGKENLGFKLVSSEVHPSPFSGRSTFSKSLQRRSIPRLGIERRWSPYSGTELPVGHVKSPSRLLPQWRALLPEWPGTFFPWKATRL
ncbi:unnamed protein product [Prunus armeniaca]|uniref:Uncharacterized protein n=1 Tax=Prunus armeniaca TaxID=36596 RepID=A0A6J5W0X2_PRUAR|nr:unnamed protein product [Prunus armeniaca]